MRLLWLLCIVFLFACASRVERISRDGTVTTIRVGFGNRISLDGAVVEPSEAVIQSGERIATVLAKSASEAVINKLLDSATTASIAIAKD